jgi:hypothetical protein
MARRNELSAPADKTAPAQSNEKILLPERCLIVGDIFFTINKDSVSATTPTITTPRYIDLHPNAPIRNPPITGPPMAPVPITVM